MKQQEQKTYLYAISRRDIPIAQQAIQAAHAGIEHAYLYGRPADRHPSFIHLTIKNQAHLERFRDELNANNIPTSEFHEPYQNWGLTAIACLLTESQRKLMSHLRLWRAS